MSFTIYSEHLRVVADANRKMAHNAGVTPYSLNTSTMTEREMIERLMLRAKECLDSQAYYFKNKNQTNLRYAKAKEGALRNAIYALMKRGYKPHIETDAKQLRLGQ